MEIKLNKKVFEDGKIKENNQEIKKIITFMIDYYSKSNPKIKLPMVTVQWDGLFPYGEITKTTERILRKIANENNRSFDGLIHSFVEFYKSNFLQNSKNKTREKTINCVKLRLTNEDCNIFKEIAIEDFTIEKHFGYFKTIKSALDNITVDELQDYPITENITNSLNLTYYENNEIMKICEKKFNNLTKEKVVSAAVKKYLKDNIIGENFMGRENRISITASLTPEQNEKLNEIRNSYFRIVPVTEHLISMALNGAINFDDYKSFEIPENTKNCAFNVLDSTDEKILSKMKEVKGRKIKFVTFLMNFVLSKDIETIKEYIQSRVHNTKAYTKKQQQEISNDKTFGEVEHPEEVLEQETELLTVNPEAMELQKEQFKIHHEVVKNTIIPKFKNLYMSLFIFIREKIESNLSDDEIFALFEPNHIENTFKIPSDFVLGETERSLRIKGISKAVIETCIKDIRKEKTEHIEYLKENEKKARTIFDLMYDSCKEQDDEKIKSLSSEEFLLTNEMMYLPFKGEQNIVNFCIREISSKETSNEKCYFYQNVIFRFLKEGFDITYTKINSPLEIAIETYNIQFTSIFIKDSYGKALNCRDKYGKPLSFKLIDNFEIHEINDILSFENISSPLGGGWLYDAPKEQYEGLNILHKFFSKMEKSPSFKVFYDVLIGLILQKTSNFPELLNVASVNSMSPFAYLVSQFAVNKYNNIIHKCCVSWDDKTVIEYDFYEKLIIIVIQLAKQHKMKLFFPSRFTDSVTGKNIPIWKVKEVISFITENKECFDDDIINRILSISDENGDFCDIYQDNSITKKIANLENNQGLNSFQSKQRKMISFKK